MATSPRLFRSPSRSRPHSGDFSLVDLNKKTFQVMERQMDHEVEKMFRDWDQNIVKRETVAIKPLRNSSSRNRLSPSSVFGDTERKKVLTIERVHDRDNLSDHSGDGDNISNATSDSMEDESRKPLYVMCPETGRKVVRLQFDVSGFDFKDIKVKVSGRKLIIFAIHRETDSGRKSTTEFCRKIKLPEDVDVEKLQCSYIAGILTAEAPVVSRDLGIKHRLNTLKLEQLNTPIIRDTDNGKMVHIFVELGRIFKPDDVVVKLKGHDKLLITAQRKEENRKDTLTASVTREFHLPARIYPHSLKAGLTQDGILNVTALVQEASPVNGDAQPPKSPRSPRPDRKRSDSASSS